MVQFKVIPDSSVHFNSVIINWLAIKVKLQFPYYNRRTTKQPIMDSQCTVAWLCILIQTLVFLYTSYSRLHYWKSYFRQIQHIPRCKMESMINLWNPFILLCCLTECNSGTYWKVFQLYFLAALNYTLNFDYLHAIFIIISEIL